MLIIISTKFQGLNIKSLAKKKKVAIINIEFMNCQRMSFQSSKKKGLIHAMHSNGALHQVDLEKIVVGWYMVLIMNEEGTNKSQLAEISMKGCL